MPLIVTLNAGSSSIKFALFKATTAGLRAQARGQVAPLGAQARLTLAPPGGARRDQALGPTDHASAMAAILAAIGPLAGGRKVAGLGHRVVHGGPRIDGPRRIDAALLKTLADLAPLAPLHQPHNLAGITAAQAAFPEALQLACFDTAFHRGHPWVNDTFALPRRYFDQGVRRYGFHGLSYDHIRGVLARDWPDLAAGRVIVAHLGNGASICALDGGRSVASSMGFSALDGLPMGTRSGQLDPGVLLYMMQTEGLDAAAISDILYRQSGLLGLSGISSDMRELLASPAPEAAEALAYFVFRLKREIGAMAAALGGIDALVFTGGIGENAAPIRARALDGLGFLGLAAESRANAAHATQIGAGPVPVLVIPTDEEAVIARAVARALAPDTAPAPDGA